MNQIEIDDIKLWIGELLLENKLLQKEVERLRNELAQMKIGPSDDEPINTIGETENRKEKIKNNG